MKIEILESGCPRCQQTTRNIVIILIVFILTAMNMSYAVSLDEEFIRKVIQIDKQKEQLLDVLQNEQQFQKNVIDLESSLQSLFAAFPDGGPAKYDDWNDHTKRVLEKIDSLKVVPAHERVKAWGQIDHWMNILFAGIHIEQALRSHKPVAVLFSTSISCQCTLRLCQSYEKELPLITSSLNNEINLVILDAFYRPDVAKRFKALFQPTLLILDSHGKELKRFENKSMTSEQMTTELKTILQK